MRMIRVCFRRFIRKHCNEPLIWDIDVFLSFENTWGSSWNPLLPFIALHHHRHHRHWSGFCRTFQCRDSGFVKGFWVTFSHLRVFASKCLMIHDASKKTIINKHHYIIITKEPIVIQGFIHWNLQPMFDQCLLVIHLRSFSGWATREPLLVSIY